VTDHLCELPGTGWRVWRQAMLRGTGFPADGLSRLTAPDLATVADAYLDGAAEPEKLDAALADALARGSAAVHAIATDPLFREAVTWQSRSVLTALDRVAAAGPTPDRDRKHRERERIVARYWQRYCAKAETIGFFGPICWVEVGPGGPGVSATAGPRLARRRQVFLEHWALAAFADTVAADPAARPHLAPALQPHLALDGRRLLDPTRPPAALSAAEAAVLSRCDGRRTAATVAREVAAEPRSGVRTEAAAYALLDRFAATGTLRWDLDVPVRLDAEMVLLERLAAIGDPAVREPALAALDRLAAARDGITAAAGDPAALATALSTLDDEFTAVTGRAPARAAGQMYAGRGLCWEETTRDLDVRIGGPVLAALAPPLDVVLRASRWVTAAVAGAYLDALRGLYRELAADLGTAEVPLGQLWFLAQGLFYGAGARPVDAVATDLTRRWELLFGLPAGGRVVRVPLPAAAVLDDLFPARRPGWSSGRLHSPDLQICAEDVDALNRGEFTVVLGEMHIAWATNTCGVFVSGYPDPAALTAMLRADLGPRLSPLLPADWPRYTARLAFALEHPDDPQLGFAAAPGADRRRLLPISALTVSERHGWPVVSAPDGRCWPLLEIFDRPLAEVAVEAFKLAGTGPHTPRLVLDTMVVARETWRTTVGACPLATAVGDRDRVLAARRWARALGLPDRVFVKIGTETKPMYADLTSPLYVISLASAIRAARLGGGDAVGLTVSEMLPDTDQAWLPDGAGRRYVSELRLQIVDPELPATAGPGHAGVAS
jgi:Lantibiotic dehydratase, N terminus